MTPVDAGQDHHHHPRGGRQAAGAQGTCPLHTRCPPAATPPPHSKAPRTTTRKHPTHQLPPSEAGRLVHGDGQPLGATASMGCCRHTMQSVRRTLSRHHAQKMQQTDANTSVLGAVNSSSVGSGEGRQKAPLNRLIDMGERGGGAVKVEQRTGHCERVCSLPRHLLAAYKPSPTPRRAASSTMSRGEERLKCVGQCPTRRCKWNIVL